MIKCSSSPSFILRATPAPNRRTISPLPIWRPTLILEGYEIQTIPAQNGLFSAWPLRRCGAQWVESGGLPPIPPSTQGLCEVNHLPPARYLPKWSLFTLLCDKLSLFTRTHQIDFSHINPKKPQIIVFIVFNCNFPCTRLWTLKSINPRTLALRRCQKLPNFLPA